jgi:hypothetical protein
LACFLKEMLTRLKRKFKFVNMAGNAFNRITDKLMEWEYEINVSITSAA